jgi:hypothetical protein
LIIAFRAGQAVGAVAALAVDLGDLAIRRR